MTCVLPAALTVGPFLQCQNSEVTLKSVNIDLHCIVESILTSTVSVTISVLAQVTKQNEACFQPRQNMPLHASDKTGFRPHDCLNYVSPFQTVSPSQTVRPSQSESDRYTADLSWTMVPLAGAN